MFYNRMVSFVSDYGDVVLHDWVLPHSTLSSLIQSIPRRVKVFLSFLGPFSLAFGGNRGLLDTPLSFKVHEYSQSFKVLVFQY